MAQALLVDRSRLAVVLILSGYGLGLFLAAQVWPVTLLIVRSILRGGRALAVGLAMACAIVLIDLGTQSVSPVWGNC